MLSFGGPRLVQIQVGCVAAHMFSRHTRNLKAALSSVELSPGGASITHSRVQTSENYTRIYMSLNIKRHIYVSYTTYNLIKKIKCHIIFLIRHVIYFEIKQHVIVLYNV